MTLRDRVLRLADRVSGVGCHEVPLATPQQVATTAWRLARDGHLYVAKMGRGRTRWFTSETGRDEFIVLARHGVTINGHHSNSRSGQFAHAAGSAGLLTQAERDQALAAYDGPVTVCPGYTPRFRAADLPFQQGCQRGRV